MNHFVIQSVIKLINEHNRRDYCENSEYAKNEQSILEMDGIM